MAFIAASCSNDPEEAFIPGGPLKEMGKDGPRSQSEGLFLPAMAGKAMTRANNDGYADEDSVVAYGSDRTVIGTEGKGIASSRTSGLQHPLPSTLIAKFKPETIHLKKA